MRRCVVIVDWCVTRGELDRHAPRTTYQSPLCTMNAIEAAPIKPRCRRLAAAGGCDRISVGTQLLAFRSGRTGSWHTGTEQHAWFVQSSYGWLSFVTVSDRNTFHQVPSRYDYYDKPPVKQPGPKFPPVRFFQFSPPAHLHADLLIAYWLLLPIALILPTIAFARQRRRRRREAGGLCPTCGYDLRAHAAGDRCPECGTSIQTTRGSCTLNAKLTILAVALAGHARLPGVWICLRFKLGHWVRIGHAGRQDVSRRGTFYVSSGQFVVGWEHDAPTRDDRALARHSRFTALRLQTH